MFVDIIKAFIL